MSVELAESPRQLLDVALADAKDRSSGTPDAILRIVNGVSRRFFPYAEESWILGGQLLSPGYASFVRKVKNFLNATVGDVVCSDGRIQVMSLGDPLVDNVDRRLQGLFMTRSSTRDRSTPVLDDPYLAASLDNSINSRKRQKRSSETVHFPGPHIHSKAPIKGCGAAKEMIVAMGHFPDLGMKYGGIAEYFEKLGDGFFAFNNNAERAGGHGTTFDYMHDAYSEGGIVGIRAQYHNFNEQSLRANLLRLHEQGLIVMSELLDHKFGAAIEDITAKMNIPGFLNLRDPQQYAANAMAIGSIALEIAAQQEKEDFPWIPEVIKKDGTDASIRTLGYKLIRNVVYRIRGNIQPGNHDLIHHPEKLVSLGSTSALFNRENIPLLQKSPPEQFDEKDIEEGLTLYRLLGEFMTEQEIDLHTEGRIIVVTGEFDRSIYVNDEKAGEALNRVASVVRNNAAKIRKSLDPSIATGEAVVLGGIHEPETRKLIAVV